MKEVTWPNHNNTFNDKRLKIKENNPAKNKSFKSNPPLLLEILNNKYSAEQPIVGMLINNDISTESFLENLKNLAPVIVVPDRLAPGINAKDWKIPIIRASSFVISEIVLFCFVLSEMYKKIEKTILAIATIINCLEKSINKNVSITRAAIIMGTVDIINGKIKLLLFFWLLKKPNDSTINFLKMKTTAKRLPKWTAISKLMLFFELYTSSW